MKDTVEGWFAIEVQLGFDGRSKFSQAGHT